MALLLLAPVCFYYLWLRLFLPFDSEAHSGMAASGLLSDDEGVVEEYAVEQSGCCFYKGIQHSRRSLYVRLVYWSLVTCALAPVLLTNKTMHTEPSFFTILGWNFFGSLLLMTCCLISIEVVYLGYFCYTKAYTQIKFQEFMNSRRRKMQMLIAVSAWSILSVISISVAYKTPNVVHIEIPLESFPQCLDGYTMLMISDVHAGPLVGKKEVEHLVSVAKDTIAANDVRATLLVGDFSDGSPSEISSILDDFASLRRVSVDDVYYVTGNHEYYHGDHSAEWISYWQRKGVRVLNATQVVQLPLRPDPATQCHDSFDLIGTSDYSKTKNSHELADLVENHISSDRATVLLAHQPNHNRMYDRSKVSIQLSGHTHGGQVWPLHLATYVANDYFAGLYEAGADGNFVYVNQGAFGWGCRLRFLSMNEITLVTLRNKQLYAAAADTHIVLASRMAKFSVPFALVVALYVLVVNVAPSVKRAAAEYQVV